MAIRTRERRALRALGARSVLDLSGSTTLDVRFAPPPRRHGGADPVLESLVLADRVLLETEIPHEIPRLGRSIVTITGSAIGMDATVVLSAHSRWYRVWRKLPRNAEILARLIGVALAVVAVLTVAIIFAEGVLK